MFPALVHCSTCCWNHRPDWNVPWHCSLRLRCCGVPRPFPRSNGLHRSNPDSLLHRRCVWTRWFWVFGYLHACRSAGLDASIRVEVSLDGKIGVPVPDTCYRRLCRRRRRMFRSGRRVRCWAFLVFECYLEMRPSGASSPWVLPAFFLLFDFLFGYRRLGVLHIFYVYCREGPTSRLNPNGWLVYFRGLFLPTCFFRPERHKGIRPPKPLGNLPIHSTHSRASLLSPDCRLLRTYKTKPIDNDLRYVRPVRCFPSYRNWLLWEVVRLLYDKEPIVYPGLILKDSIYPSLVRFWTDFRLT